MPAPRDVVEKRSAEYCTALVPVECEQTVTCLQTDPPPLHRVDARDDPAGRQSRAPPSPAPSTSRSSGSKRWGETERMPCRAQSTAPTTRMLIGEAGYAWRQHVEDDRREVRG